MNRQESADFLKTVEWQEGKRVILGEGSYRHRIVAVLTEGAAKVGDFANGKGKYCEFVEFMDASGQWIQRGNGILPVLPDGRFLFIVERRPAQSFHGPRPMVARIGGKDVDLRKFNPHASLEISGGAADADDTNVVVGALREAMEENAIPEQAATLYHCLRPVHLFGSDIAIHHHSNALFLSESSFEAYAKTDGGLNVLALTQEDVWENIYNGVICSGQAAHATWYFFQEVLRGQKDAEHMAKLLRMGYLAKREVRLVKPKPK